MLMKHSILAEISDSKVVAVIRGQNPEEAVQLSKGAIEGGIRAIELTYTTPQVDDVFRQLRNEDVLLGAGSVLDPETALHAILLGAKFIVSPHFNKGIAILCNRHGIPYMPGCMTIREMVEALEAGCDVLKLFPANQFDPSFIRSVNGPLPHARLMPTGGINLDNIEDWLEAGAVACGIGSDLNKEYQQGGFDAVVKLSEKYANKC
ncbi:bifunctional 2-keto-4-hydroxyglutarate aldolase/2-keto-3-deoxy-6-phosphogluconate aldolase [Pseudalkalibacillus salsuginis]|uniref:bifunctional 2-keto-4-hydroxyglutarate aldolase/2-keto-3-deoxy-6-phosphogluconate aldolase n=1 Tax=Pseudalkalibacillus salsuginis TaxID=2910972 RepID=UPI001F4471D3|nr:bifunctional 2-keto-4-hydroxyglutarate aldolase/2-keto-3-deoxy-6-phosphogluconate aldolase [Pseudalkalibacillus salsuginis]MCF6410058.1 bifunctional 2-keto-4-hydroxyglutarate aldolase/2-keto-3-deoxy-6-phosphogluconate aldolase [Pseudalkalibacillus salsuginis]